MKRIYFTILIFCMVAGLSLVNAGQSPILVIDSKGHTSVIKDVMFTPDGETLVSVSMDKTIRIWDVSSSELKQTIRIPIGPGIEGVIHSGALSPDGKVLAVGAWPYENQNVNIPIYLISLETARVIKVLKAHDDVISSIEFTRNGKWLISGGDTRVKIWDLTTYQTVNTIPGHVDGVVAAAASKNGKMIVSADYSGKLYIRELSKDLASIVSEKTIKADHPEIIDVALSADSTTIATIGSDYKVALWDIKGHLKRKIDIEGYPGTVVFSNDGKKVVVAGTAEAPATVYDISSGRQLAAFGKHTDYIAASAIYDNKWAATAGGHDKDIYVWDIKTGRIISHMAGKGRAVWSVAFGKNFNLAMGNTYTGLGMINPGRKEFSQFSDFPEYVPLEYTFNLGEMRLNRNMLNENEFVRANTVSDGRTIKRESWETLSVSSGNTITHTGPGAKWIRSYTFLSKGRVAAGFESWLRTYEPDGRLVWESMGHTGYTYGLSVSKTGDLLASSNDDQTVKIWNSNSGELLATFFMTRDFEWVFWTPQGFYQASAGGEKYIGWQINQGPEKIGRFFPVSVFKKQFLRPDIVKQTIIQKNFAAALANVEQSDNKKKVQHRDISRILPPSMEWVSPGSFESMTQSEIQTIRFKIRGSQSVKQIKILVNGRVQGTDRGLKITKENDNVVEKQVVLRPGENRIQIYASNGESGVTSQARTIILEQPRFSDHENWEKPNAYMVAVGISAYADPKLNLTYADDDAKAMSALFQSQQGKLYKQVMVKQLYDTDATRDSVLDALEWLEQQTTQKDVAVIFIAAHGMNDQRGRFYLLPADGEPDRLRRTGIDWGEFIDVLGNLPSRVLFFLDTCHSGRLGENLVRMRSVTDNTEAIRELSSDENGVIILAASTGREFSMEHPDWGHGAFTKALLEGMAKGAADYSKDGIIHLRELDTYIADRVKELTKGRQHPTTLKPSSISRFPIVQVGK